MQLIDAASAEFERVVRALPADSWDRPTPSDMSVRELVVHVVGGNRLTAWLLSGLDRQTAVNQLGTDLLGTDPLAAVLESAGRQATAFATTPPDRLVSGPRGDQIPAAAFLRFRVVDLVVHGWDLLRAGGLDEHLDPDVVAGAVDLVEPHLAEMLGYGVYGEGPSASLPAGASPQDRLLDWFGRRP